MLRVLLHVVVRALCVVLSFSATVAVQRPSAAEAAGEPMFSVLYAFGSGPKHRSPQTGLIQGSDGYLYGTTLWGGTRVGGWNEPGTGDIGVVFRTDGTGDLRVRHVFDQGSYQTTNVVQGSDGALYGTTQGLVYKMEVSGAFTVLNEGFRSFPPPSSLIQATDGNFYGSAAFADGGRGSV